MKDKFHDMRLPQHDVSEKDGGNKMQRTGSRKQMTLGSVFFSSKPVKPQGNGDGQRSLFVFDHRAHAACLKQQLCTPSTVKRHALQPPV
jgi:hypothetical protein